ncbi:MAG: hypothetical protein IH885_03345 [Myxococcales bacterium]|nr:hypothetical protein [Myxococcales bacterium]
MIVSPRLHAFRNALRAAVALCIGVTSASAAVPSAEKIADAVAETNRLSGRSVPVLLEVTLRIGDGEPVATGVLASHPTGLARLELQSRRGFVERHLLQGNSYTASRDGQLLKRPHPFLPPTFFLQAESGAAFRAALASYGVASGEVALGRVADRDCYVFGGRLPRGAEGEERMLPSVWVDMETYQIVQIDRPGGVRFRFGPMKAFEEIQAPSWIEVVAPDQPDARLDVVRVVPANAPAAAFGMDWLTALANP